VLFRGLILAVSVAFVAFVFVLMDVLAKAGLDARLMWIIGAMVTGVAIIAVAALSLSARWRNGGHSELGPLIAGLGKSDIGVALIDAYGRTIYANPAFSRKLGIEPGSDMLSALEARLSFLGIGSDELAELRTRAMRGEGGQMFVDLSRSEKFASQPDGETQAPATDGAENPAPGDDAASDDKTSSRATCLRISVAEANARAGQMLWTVDGVDPSVMADADASMLLPSGESSSAFALSAPVAPDLVANLPVSAAAGGFEHADQMIERLPVGVCGLDEEGRILYLNQRGVFVFQIVKSRELSEVVVIPASHIPTEI